MSPLSPIGSMRRLRADTRLGLVGGGVAVSGRRWVVGAASSALTALLN